MVVVVSDGILVFGTVVSGTVVDVVAVNCHNDKLLMVRFPGWQQVSIEY